MKPSAPRLAAYLSAALLLAAPAAAQLRTAVPTGFTYQGVLTDNGSPVNGPADLRFTLYPTETSTTPAGPPVFLTNITIADGLFSGELDFGLDALEEPSDWLEIAVSTPPGAGFVTLSPRQHLGAAPSAVNAAGSLKRTNGDTILGDPYTTLVVAQNTTFSGELVLSDVWQSFVPTTTGELESVNFEAALLGVGSTFLNATFTIYEGEGAGGTPIATGSGGFYFIGQGVFDPGTQLYAGTTYTLHIQLLNPIGSGGLRYSAANPYPQGRASTAPGEDLVFRVQITDADNPTAKVDGSGRYFGRGLSIGTRNDDTLAVFGESFGGLPPIDNDERLVVNANSAYISAYGFTTAFPSGLVLGDGIATSGLDSKWAIRHAGSGNSDQLRFSYTTDVDFNTIGGELTLTSDGRLGIGTNAPGAPLHVNTPTNVPCEVYLKSGGSYTLKITQMPDSTFVISNNGDRLFLETNGRLGIGVDNPAYRLELPNNADVSGRGRANSWVTYSSERFKDNIETLDDPIDTVNKLRGVGFDWKPEYGGTHDVGFVAEEVAEVFPELVTFDENGTATGVDYGRLVPVAIEAIKAQQQTIESQNARIEKLEQAVERLLNAPGG